MLYDCYVSKADCGSMVAPLIPADGRDTKAEAKIYFGSEPFALRCTIPGEGYSDLTLASNVAPYVKGGFKAAYIY